MTHAAPTRNPIPRVLSRTWRVQDLGIMDGAVVTARELTVTLRRTRRGLSGLIDGVRATAAEVLYRLRALRADPVVLSEVLNPDHQDAQPVIGKRRACTLHRLMAAFGLREHYALASCVVGREVASLAALTETEARAVWRVLREMFPERTAAAVGA
ncbi:hypothetical protein [Deinococcus petrolearius]|uniref:Uncharacterized protein n=1 Tax=Deinococcus petrolearius TaxID=1751295 RepID=A0ABW1DDT8_9DEIO